MTSSSDHPGLVQNMFSLNVRDHEDLAMLVNGAFCDFVDDPHSRRLRFARTGLVGDILPGGSHIDILPRARVADVFTATFQFVQPSLLDSLRGFRFTMNQEPSSIRIPRFSAASFPESMRINSGFSIIRCDTESVSFRNSGVCC